MTILWFVLGGLVWLVVGGFVGTRVSDNGKPLCVYSRHDLGCGHVWLGISVAGLLPLALPALIGLGMSRRYATTLSRTERRRARELAEAEHMAELAKIRALEDQYLSRQLRSLDI